MSEPMDCDEARYDADPQENDAVQGHTKEWAIALLPALPVALLMLKLWYLSDQSMETTQLLIQYVSPISLASALFRTIVWTIPAAILMVRCIAGILQITLDDPARSKVVRISSWIPSWVVWLSFLISLLSWEIQFLAVLLVLALTLVGLEARRRLPGRPLAVLAFCICLPVLATSAYYGVALLPAIRAWQEGDYHLCGVLTVPPLLALAFNRPIPAFAARKLLDYGGAFIALLLLLAIMLRFAQTPVLPTVAVETKPDPLESSTGNVLVGHIINTDDRVVIFMDLKGEVHFIPNDDVISQTLCRDYSQAPYSRITIVGRRVEETLLQKADDSRESLDVDQRCFGWSLDRVR